MKKIVIFLSIGFLIIFIALFVLVSRLLPDMVPALKDTRNETNLNENILDEKDEKKDLVTDKTGEIVNSDNELVVIESPDLGNFLDSEFILEGTAPGAWFNDGVLTINLLDSFGKKIAVSYAGTKGIWTVNSEVEFSALFEYLPPESEDGLIVFVDASNKAKYSIPIKFKATIAGAGETCASNEECELPADYAIRSICPYQIECLHNKCTVVCPDL